MIRLRAVLPVLAVALAVAVAGGAPPAPARARRALAPDGCQTVRFTPAGTVARFGDLCLPAGDRKRAVVLVVHGGGGFEGDRRSSAAWATRLRRAGHPTFAVDYFTYGPDSPPPAHPRAVTDVKTAVQWLRRSAPTLGVDAERIVVQGISFGATIGGQVLVTPDDPLVPGRWPATSDRVAGLIGLYGYYDGWQLDEVRFYGGDATSADPRVRRMRASADSVARARGATGPAFLVTGDRDGLVAPAHTARFARALRRAGVPVEERVVAGVGHGFDRPGGPTLSPVGELLARDVLAWLDRHFPA